MSSKLIIALDFPSSDEALKFIKPLSPELCKLKVGFELFVSSGPDFVRILVDKGYDVFLDLKFHDIPNTVASACKAASRLGIWMMNVHASGSVKMMTEAKKALLDSHSNTKIIAVTVLTSMDNVQLQATNITISPQQQVKELAILAHQSGLDGVVCSAQEAKILREEFGEDFLLVTPGIRPNGVDAEDQSRVMSPYQAKVAGVSYIVVGRPITLAENPLSVIDTINIDMT